MLLITKTRMVTSQLPLCSHTCNQNRFCSETFILETTCTAQNREELNSLYAGHHRSNELEEEDQIAAQKAAVRITYSAPLLTGISKSVYEPHLSTRNSFPPASAMDPSFFMTTACLQGCIDAATTEECGNGSTVMVLRACSSLTSSRTCDNPPYQLCESSSLSLRLLNGALHTSFGCKG